MGIGQRTCLEEKQWKEAAETFARAAEVKQDDSQLWLESGRAAAKLEDWEQVAQTFAQALALLPEDPSNGAGRAHPCVELAGWDQAFARVVQLRPKDQTLWLGRARYHAKRSRWKEAASDFAKAAALQPPHQHWIEHACGLLLTDDANGYRRFCTTAVEQADKSIEPFTVYVLARTCALSPESGVEPGRILTWARQALTTDRRQNPYINALGVALYRAGQYTQAIEELEEITDRLTVGSRFIMAMAHHRLGHSEEGRKLLEKAMRDLDSLRPKRAATPVDMASADWMEAHILWSSPCDLGLTIRNKKPPLTVGYITTMVKGGANAWQRIAEGNSPTTVRLRAGHRKPVFGLPTAAVYPRHDPGLAHRGPRASE